METFTVDEIWKGLRALGSSVPHDSILASAKRQKLYVSGVRSRQIHESRLGELTRDLGIDIDPTYIAKVYSEPK